MDKRNVVNKLFLSLHKKKNCPNTKLFGWIIETTSILWRTLTNKTNLPLDVPIYTLCYFCLKKSVKKKFSFFHAIFLRILCIGKKINFYRWYWAWGENTFKVRDEAVRNIEFLLLETSHRKNLCYLLICSECDAFYKAIDYYQVYIVLVTIVDRC